MKQRKEYKHLCDETEYIIKNGMRYVKPYIYRHETNCKQRWFGRTILDVFSTEFGAYSADYYRDAIVTGRIVVNNKKVSTDYLLKNGDVICHTVHRHEPPVPYDPVHIVGETDELIAVNKPSSIPVHTCGAYRYNSLEMILKVEGGFQNIYLIHRLDRVTSGIVLLAKQKETAARLSESLRQGGVHKVYLAEVEGQWKWQEEWNQKSVDRVGEAGVGVSVVSQRDGIMRCDAEQGKSAYTYFCPLLYSPQLNHTLLVCLPITGRTHQIRLHCAYLGHPIDNDMNYNPHVYVPK
ncbi:pseudouridylate synthase [Blastocystis sp. subtype 4]|uniref:pseudouridylate synthase n=1 Tax=Blastocystis sp. subtype 4 TaxID=944170 RepID=UPI000711FC5C|nr:pseudouridylate synthase [Blastocystis sp. subtype 4]KNB46209.1 pseudouridylate synthase [Blastocystis sp. subtype 4]|eukprot:XP_014529652.1 pseudouridylate synthase [Blastocystis sp. subtype 4]